MMKFKWASEITEEDISDKNYECYSPIDGDLLGIIEHKDQKLIPDIARRALVRWKSVENSKKIDAFRKFIKDLSSPKNDIKDIFIDELGITENAAKDKIEKTANIIRNIIETDKPKSDSLIEYYPHGTVLIITDSINGLETWAEHAFSALLCGNTVIWKPSSKTAISSIIINEMLSSVIREYCGKIDSSNIIICDSEYIKNSIRLGNYDVVCANGNDNVITDLTRLCSTKSIKTITTKVSNSIVIDDEKHFESIIRYIKYCLNYNGQNAYMPRMIYLRSEIFNEFASKMETLLTEKIVVGDPLIKTTTMGPLLSEERYKKYISVLDSHKKNVVCKGERILSKLENAYYVMPSLITNSENLDNTKLPCIFLRPYENYNDIGKDDIVCLFVSDIDRMKHMKSEIKAEQVYINKFPTNNIDLTKYCIKKTIHL
ncbi:MAG: aldehyde dehydrogenase family protein [Candidimonas sp.]